MFVHKIHPPRRDETEVEVYIDANTQRTGDVVWCEGILTIKWRYDGDEEYYSYKDNDKILYQYIERNSTNMQLFIVDNSPSTTDMIVWFYPSTKHRYALTDTILFDQSIAFEPGQPYTFTGKFVVAEEDDTDYHYNDSLIPDPSCSANKIFNVFRPSIKQIKKKYYELLITNLAKLTQPPYSLFLRLNKDVISLLLDYLCRMHNI